MTEGLWYNLPGLERGQKESSTEGRLGTQTWRFGPAGPRAKQTAKHEQKERPKLGRLFEIVPKSGGQAFFAGGGFGGFHRLRMVFRKASKAHRGGGRHGQRNPRGQMRPLRIRRRRQGRQKGRRGAKIPLPIMRQKIQPPDQHRFRLPQNPGIGMGGIPPPPLRVPFGQNLGQGQQKRRNHRRLLAQESLRRFGGVPGIRRPFRRGLDRRDLRFRRQSGQGNKGREGAPRHIEEQNRDSGRDRRERPRRHAGMDLEAIEEKDFRNIPPPHSPRLQAHPRRGQFPFAFGFGTRLGKRGASNLGDEGVAGFLSLIHI